MDDFHSVFPLGSNPEDEDDSLTWTGDVTHYTEEDGTEVPVLILANGTWVELRPDGVSHPDSGYVVSWGLILQLLFPENQLEA